MQNQRGLIQRESFSPGKYRLNLSRFETCFLILNTPRQPPGPLLSSSYSPQHKLPMMEA
jgi:hypothetical protein